MLAVGERASIGLKRTIHAHKLGDDSSVIPHHLQRDKNLYNDHNHNHKVEEDDENDDDENDDEIFQDDQVTEDKEISILSKTYSEPFKLVAMIKKMKEKKKHRG